MKSLLIFSALLSLALVYSTQVTTEFSVDGNSADWDTAKVAPAFSKGTSFNKVNMQSTGLHTYACANQITMCRTAQPWLGSLRTLSPFVNTVSIFGSLSMPSRGAAANGLGHCTSRRGKANKSFVFPAVYGAAGNLRVTAVAVSPQQYANGAHALENFAEGTAFTLTFSRTFPSIEAKDWKSIPTAISTTTPTCAAALPNTGLDCPSGLFYYKSYGIVFLSGLFLPYDPTSVLRATTFVFATLPEEARPQYDNDYVVTCDTVNIGYVTVKTTGQITFTGKANKWCSLDGVSYLYAQEIPGGSGDSPFNFKFGSLYRSPAADSKSPVVAVTKEYGVQFLTPFQNGIGSTLASFDAPAVCDGQVDIKFPVVIDSQLAFARSSVSGGSFTFTLESAALSPASADYRRAFAAHNSATGYFALLLQGYGTPATLLFTFADGENTLKAAAAYTPSTGAFVVSSGAASFTGATSATGANSLFEFSFSEPSLAEAGNQVTVTVGADSFTYYFN